MGVISCFSLLPAQTHPMFRPPAAAEPARSLERGQPRQHQELAFVCSSCWDQTAQGQIKNCALLFKNGYTSNLAQVLVPPPALGTETPSLLRSSPGRASVSWPLPRAGAAGAATAAEPCCSRRDPTEGSFEQTWEVECA